MNFVKKSNTGVTSDEVTVKKAKRGQDASQCLVDSILNQSSSGLSTQYHLNLDPLAFGSSRQSDSRTGVNIHLCESDSHELVSIDSDSSQNGSVTVNAMGAIPILTALSVGVSQK
eukprot:25374-Amphidinium_carterae.1